MSKVGKLLEDKERQGLLYSFLSRIFMILSIVFGHLETHHSKMEVVIVVSSGILMFLLAIMLLAFVYYRKFLILSGYGGILIDLFLIIILPYTWYESVGGFERVPPSYILKTTLPLWIFCIIAINGLALRPIFPLIVSVFFVVFWESILYFVMRDPRTVITNSFLETFFSEAIIPAVYRMPQLAACVTGGIISYITYSYRRNVQKAVDLEVKNSQLGRYFSPNVIETISAEEDTFRFTEKSQKVVVLFSDIRNFTSISEKLKPVEVVEFLRDYHSRMVKVIFEYGGTLDKFIGDGIMVTFGTPYPQPDDCYRAVMAAISMRTALDVFNMERIQKGLFPIQQGIGIHYGEVISGNIGSSQRMEYTVIGDTVNVASRIESCCKQYNCDILISKDVHEKIPGSIDSEFVDTTTLKGKEKTVGLYKVK